MAQKNGDKLKLFISYSRQDTAVTDQLVAALEDAGFDVSIDRRDLPYGEEWQSELADFIRAADTVVWLVSPASAASKWCNWELGEVQRLKKRLLPVRIGDVGPEDLPAALGKIHVLPAESVFEFDAHLAPLITALNTDQAWLKEHTRLGDRARQWLAKGKKGDLLLRGTALSDAEDWKGIQPNAAPPSEEILDLIHASRRAHGKRQQIAVLASLAVAVIAVALSLFALIQRNEAQEQRLAAIEAAERADERRIEAEVANEKAQAALRTATQTANRLVVDLARRFENSSIPIEVTQSILEEARKLQAHLSENFSEDEELDVSQGIALSQLGDTYRKRGDLDEALSLHEQALEIFRARAARDPEDMGWQSDVASTLRLIGQIHLTSGDIGKAASAFQESLDITREVAAHSPDNIARQRDVATSLILLGDIHRNAGDFRSALSAFQESLEIGRALAADAPEKADLFAGILRSLHAIGNVYLLDGDTKNALKAFGEGISTARPLLLQNPGNTRLQHVFSAVLSKTGFTLLSSGNANEALAAFEEALDVSRTLSASEPANTLWQGIVMNNLSIIGDAQYRTGNMEGALASYKEGLEIARSLALHDPENTEWKFDVAENLLRLGDTHRRNDDKEAALRAYREGVDLLVSLIARDSNHTAWQFELAITYDKIALVSPTANAKRDAWAQALSILQRLEKENRLTEPQRNHIGIVRGSLALLNG